MGARLSEKGSTGMEKWGWPEAEGIGVNLYFFTLKTVSVYVHIGLYVDTHSSPRSSHSKGLVAATLRERLLTQRPEVGFQVLLATEKKQGSLEKQLMLRWGRETQGESGTLHCGENDEITSGEHRSQFKDLPTNLIWDNLDINISDNRIL